MSKKKDKKPGDDFMNHLLKGKEYDLTNKVIHNFEPITKESMDKSKLADVQKGEDGITRVNIGGATYATDGEVGEEYYKVRLTDKKIITIEKSGRIIHIFDDRSK